MADWAAMKGLIEGGKRFAVTGHIYPDGDAIGSTVAFSHLLRALGKEAMAVMPVPVPAVYRFLDENKEILVYEPGKDNLFAGLDAFFMLDSSTNDRLGPLHDLAVRLNLFRVSIDHHPDNSTDADLKIVDPEACSTAQLIYELYSIFGVEIGPAAAEALYTGIHTDTVSFNFLGTNARTHEIAAQLLRIGVEPKKTWMRIYGNESPRLLTLAGLALSGLRMTEDGSIAWLTVRETQWRKLGVHPNETEAFTRYPLTLSGVGVIALFCEEGRGRTRVCLRALDNTDVGGIASSFGGGGHRSSAGAAVNGELEKVVEQVIAALQEKKLEHGVLG